MRQRFNRACVSVDVSFLTSVDHDHSSELLSSFVKECIALYLFLSDQFVASI